MSGFQSCPLDGVESGGLKQSAMSNAEKHTFQAEIQEVLNIVIHSLYTDKEIFVRELVSNAADALEKVRFLQTSGATVFQPDAANLIRITTDDKAHTLTFADTGVGMTRDELVENLGTIAHSGSKAFIKKLAEDKKAGATLIGQFGVGFYSAFMVAAKVIVHTRSHLPDEPAWSWTSEGAQGYEIAPGPSDQPRGTTIVLHLKEEQKDFARAFRIESIIQRYSSFVPFPIELNGKSLNTVRALWSRSKSEIKEEDYNEFYRFIGHDSEPPLLRLHYTADAPLSIQALLFVPAKNYEALGLSRTESDVNLYCKKVLIQPKAKGLFPEWLRFLKGAVDCEDLPLNISRESMQDSSLIQKLSRALTGRFIKHLDETAAKEPQTYETFYKLYARNLKEGAISDYTHREAVSKLLRYESSTLEPGKTTSLADYVQRMATGQTEIFFLVAPNRESAESSPYYEAFRVRKLEVLFFLDPWDEFVADNLGEFEGKKLKAAEKADIKVEDTETEGPLTADQASALAAWMKETLGIRVHDVRVSKRLVGSPAVVVDSDEHMTSTMRRLMKAMQRDGPAAPATPPTLEINPKNTLVARLEALRQQDAALAGKVAAQMLDNALVSAGMLEDPRQMLQRLNELLEHFMAKP